MVREKTEWSQIYWYDTHETTLPRILLIGDSIVTGHREFLVQALKGIASVAAYSTSRMAGNPVFMKELELVLSDLPPGLICFNNGLHDFSTGPDDYGKGLSAVIFFLRSKGFQRIVWRNSTPISIADKPSELSPRNETVLLRNRKAAEVMAAEGIPVIDMYTPMLNHPEYRNPDGYHYQREGQQMQAELLKKALLPLLPRKEETK